MGAPNRSPMETSFSISEVNRNDDCMQVVFRRDVVGSFINICRFSHESHPFKEALSLLMDRLIVCGNHLFGAEDKPDESVFEEILNFGGIDEVNQEEGWVSISFLGAEVINAVAALAEGCDERRKYSKSLWRFGSFARKAADYLDGEIPIEELGTIAELIVDSSGKEYEIRNAA